MSQWSTELSLYRNNTIEIGPIKIQKGIFQEDALSLLWFYLALNPLSYMLNEIEHKVNHLLYMDDIKIEASSSTHINNLLHTVEVFSKGIRMGLGLYK